MDECIVDIRIVIKIPLNNILNVFVCSRVSQMAVGNQNSLNTCLLCITITTSRSGRRL